MQRSEVTTWMPRRIVHMMARAIIASAQARQRRDAVGRGGKPFVKPGQVQVEKKNARGREPRQQ